VAGRTNGSRQRGPARKSENEALRHMSVAERKLEGNWLLPLAKKGGDDKRATPAGTSRFAGGELSAFTGVKVSPEARMPIIGGREETGTKWEQCRRSAGALDDPQRKGTPGGRTLPKKRRKR